MKPSIGSIVLGCVAVLMAWMLLAGPDRSVTLANDLIRDGKAYILSEEESGTLKRFLTAFFRAQDARVDVAVNQPYRAGRLNIYIVDDSRTHNAIGPGNAAYVHSSDILFIGSSFFSIGSNRTFTRAPDELTMKVHMPLRVFAFFVIAHELGHRHHGGSRFLELFSERQRHRREEQADDYAISHLKRIYASPELREAAGVAQPVSDLLGVSAEEPTPIERMVDHLGIAVSFMADDIFDSPIPLLSTTDTHPAFFGRMNNLLERLRADAATAGDRDALGRLAMFQTIVAGTNYLVAREPIEIEFARPFQYAYLDRETLHVVGNDGSPVLAIPLHALDPGRQYARTAPPPQRNATIRFAWAGGDGRTMTLRRDGTLRLIENASGRTVWEKPVAAMFGDNSCVRQLLVPPQPAMFTYVSSCIDGMPLVARIGSNGDIVAKQVRELVEQSKQCLHPGQDAAVDLNAAGQLTLVLKCDGRPYLFTLAPDLRMAARTELAPSIDISAETLSGRVKATTKPVIADEASRPYRIRTDPLSTSITLFDARRDSGTPYATGVPDAGGAPFGLDIPASVISSFHLVGNRRIVNLAQGGAWLVDFDRQRVLPLRRKGLRDMEQISSNTGGDWMYFEKYGRRILLFKGDTDD